MYDFFVVDRLLPRVLEKPRKPASVTGLLRRRATPEFWALMYVPSAHVYLDKDTVPRGSHSRTERHSLSHCIDWLSQAMKEDARFTTYMSMHACSTSWLS